MMELKQARNTLLLMAFLPLCLSGVAHKNGQHERAEDGAFSPRDHNHQKDSEGHNANFDHEAILGSSKDAEEYDSLPPEEAKKRLAVLLTKMDRNMDEKISKDELTQWILRSFRSLSQEESTERFQDADENKDGFVTWDEYQSEEFDIDPANLEEDLKEMKNDPDRIEEYNMLQEDKMLFESADKDKDGKLNSKEYLSFSHPEEDTEMHETVLNQILEQRDANNDGKIDFQEYMGDRGKDQSKDWLMEEKERFDTELDKNKDGSLDRPEILAWMIPSNDDIARDEVEHLFAGADEDVDEILTFDEVLSHHDLFVGSEATDYGEHLNNLHKFEDEL